MGVSTQGSDRRAVIIASRADELGSLVAAAGYDVVGVADMAIRGEPLLRHLEPQLVVVENDLVGTIGLEAMSGLCAASPESQILLVVTEEWTPLDTDSAAIFAVVTKSRLSALVTERGGIESWIAGQVAVETVGENRRTGCDRRIHQDWTKVGWQRRTCERRLSPSV